MVCKNPKEGRRSKKWSPEELDVVREWCPQNAKYASELLGRSLRSVRAKALELGLASHTKTPWSDKEKEHLSEIYATSTMQELLEKFGRGHVAIAAMARKLGLRKVPAWSEEQDRRLRELYEARWAMRDISKEIGKSIVEIKGRVTQLGIRRTAFKRVVLEVIDENNVLSTCPTHGDTKHRLSKSGKLLCISCSTSYYKQHYKRKTQRPYRVQLATVREAFSRRGYSLDDDSYVSANHSCRSICPAGHTALVSYTDFVDGHRCNECAKKSRAEFQRSQAVEGYERLEESAALSGYTLITPVEEYSNAHTKVTFVCPAGHSASVQAASFLQGHGCGKCSLGGVSRPEKDVLDYICSIYTGQVLENRRDIIPPYELDIFVPAKNLAIEYNGLYWHSETLVGRRDYDKYKLCQKVGIRYVSIFEDEWRFNRLRVEGMLLNLLGRRAATVRLRPQQLTIEGIPYEQASDFLDKHHYLGARVAKYNIGLLHQQQLVGVLQFSTPSRQSKYDIELVRMCLLPYASIPGVWSYCGKHIFSEWFPGKSIVSFSDNRVHTGKVYSYMGFVNDGLVRPDYYWCKNGVRHNKSKLRKTESEKATGLTERQLRESAGYFRVFDVGKTRWVLLPAV